MCLPLARPLLGTWPAIQACALDRESNWGSFGLQAGAQSTEPYQPGPQLVLNDISLGTRAAASQHHSCLLRVQLREVLVEEPEPPDTSSDVDK